MQLKSIQHILPEESTREGEPGGANPERRIATPGLRRPWGGARAGTPVGLRFWADIKGEKK